MDTIQAQIHDIAKTRKQWLARAYKEGLGAFLRSWRCL